LLAALDHFEIQRLVGAGGMGIVLLARDTNTGGREVAIKLVRSELVSNQNVIQRFLKEAGIRKVTFGRAAKLIAIYLKSEVVLGPGWPGALRSVAFTAGILGISAILTRMKLRMQL